MDNHIYLVSAVRLKCFCKVVWVVVLGLAGGTGALLGVGFGGCLRFPRLGVPLSPFPPGGGAARLAAGG